MRPLPDITPMPPIACAALPWDTELADPVAEIARARRECGDTFVIDSPRRRTLFVFSPVGVRNFYALAEADASKGVADWMMLRHKLPEELFAGRRTTVHSLFGRDDVNSYLSQLDAAITVAFDELGSEGTVDIFAFTRRLGHRMGLASWAGEIPQQSPRFDEFVDALEILDGSAAFVHPEAMRAVAESGKVSERAALTRIEELIRETILARDAAFAQSDDLFARIMTRWSDVAGHDRIVGIAHDVVLVHMGSMSNLFAAAGWMIGHLALHPEVLHRVRSNEDGLLDRCALESTRLGQRSIILRAVLRDTVISDEQHTYNVAPGAQIATLLPLTNSSSLDGFGAYDPDRWGRRRLRDEDQLAAKELVVTFGHGEHSCPAQPFSLAAMGRAAKRLIDTYDLKPHFESIEPLAVQIGGVARSQYPCLLSYRIRADWRR